MDNLTLEKLKKMFEHPPTNKELRQMINALIQQYCTDTGTSHRDTWHILYDELNNWKQYDVVKIVGDQKISKIEQIENDGMLTALFCIAYENFLKRNAVH